MSKIKPLRIVMLALVSIFLITFIAVSLLVNGKSDVAGPFFVLSTIITVFLFFYVVWIVVLPGEKK